MLKKEVFAVYQMDQAFLLVTQLKALHHQQTQELKASWLQSSENCPDFESKKQGYDQIRRDWFATYGEDLSRQSAYQRLTDPDKQRLKTYLNELFDAQESLFDSRLQTALESCLQVVPVSSWPSTRFQLRLPPEEKARYAELKREFSSIPIQNLNDLIGGLSEEAACAKLNRFVTYQLDRFDRWDIAIRCVLYHQFMFCDERDDPRALPYYHYLQAFKRDYHLVYRMLHSDKLPQWDLPFDTDSHPALSAAMDRQLRICIPFIQTIQANLTKIHDQLVEDWPSDADLQRTIHVLIDLQLSLERTIDTGNPVPHHDRSLSDQRLAVVTKVCHDFNEKIIRKTEHQKQARAVAREETRQAREKIRQKDIALAEKDKEIVRLRALLVEANKQNRSDPESHASTSAQGLFSASTESLIDTAEKAFAAANYNSRAV